MWWKSELGPHNSPASSSLTFLRHFPSPQCSKCVCVCVCESQVGSWPTMDTILKTAGCNIQNNVSMPRFYVYYTHVKFFLLQEHFLSKVINISWILGYFKHNKLIKMNWLKCTRIHTYVYLSHILFINCMSMQKPKRK